MRLKHGLTLVLGACAILATAASADAQTRPSFGTDSASEPFASPGRVVVAPISERDDEPQFRGNNPDVGMYGPPGMGGPPTMGGPGMGGPGMGPGMGGPPAMGGPGMQAVSHDPPGTVGIPPNSQPWPTISPFENRYQEHSWVDGLWTQLTRNGRRKYHAGIQAMLFDLRAPSKVLIGNKEAFQAAGDPNPFGRDVLHVGRKTVWGERVFDKPFSTEGLRLNWGFWDPDDTGFELVGWWASDVFYNFHMFPDFDPASPPDFEPRGVVVPTDDGTEDGNIMFFDGDLKLRYQQVMVNTQVTRMMQNVFNWSDAFVVRPTYGLRYTFLRERMMFMGHDYFPTEPYRTDFKSEVSSHLFGPEIGLHTKIGSDDFNFTVGTKFILYMNIDTQRLSGNNMIDIFSYPPPAGTDLAFRSSRRTGHVSPAFEQTVHMEARIFKYIPLLKDIQLFKRGKLRGGITYLDIGEIARPYKGIEYNSFPRTPAIQTDRSKFTAFAWDVGVQFDY